MTTRKAIIIGNSGGYRDLPHIDGIDIDIDNYCSFLMSDAGGQWYRDEITILSEPDSKIVLETFASASEDYFFTVFIGYGHIETYDQEDSVSLKDRDISIVEFTAPSKKQTIIFDIRKSAIANSIAFSTQKIDYQLTKESTTREIFDLEITTLPEGILLIFSASADEIASKDVDLGSSFTYSLLKTGQEWRNNSDKKTVLRIPEALELTKKKIREISGIDQNPIMAGQVRRLTFPPFAFSKYCDSSV